MDPEDSSGLSVGLPDEDASPVTVINQQSEFATSKAAKLADIDAPFSNVLAGESPKYPINFEYQSNTRIGDAQPRNPVGREPSQQPVKIQFRDLKPAIILRPTWTCIGSPRFGGPCKVRIPQRIRELAVQEIVRLETSISTKVPSEAELAEVAKHLLCRKYHRYTQVHEIAKAWSEELSTSSQKDQLLDKDVGEKVFATTTDERPINTGDEFIKPQILQPYSIISAIVKRMRKPLLPQEENDGFIYMFARPGTPSMIKIGYTTRDVQTRLQKFAMSCHYEPNLIFQQFVHGAQHTERLVFADLMEQRRMEPTCNNGKGCLFSHREWFEIDDKRALLTVQRWTQWMDIKPYTSHGLDAFWETNLFEAEKLPSLDAFHQWIEHMTQSCIQKGENSWRGRTDGRFLNSNEELVDDGEQTPPISPVPSIVSSGVPSLVSDTTLSSTLSYERNMSAVEGFVALLLKDEVIQRLQVIALEKIGVEKFERNFFRLLKLYSKDLRKEARTPVEIQVVKFVRIRARSVASCLRNQIEPAREQKSHWYDIVSMQESGREDLLENYLNSIPRDMDISAPDLSSFNSPATSAMTKDQSSDHSEPGYSDLEKLDDIESDDSEVGNANESSLFSNGEVKEFVVRSEAFGKLRENLKDFVFPSEQHTLGGLDRTAGSATDVADVKGENLVAADNCVGAKEKPLLDRSSKSSSAGSASTTDPTRADGSAPKPTSQHSGDLVFTRSLFWQYKEPITLSGLQKWMRARWNQTMRPSVKSGYRRIEWTCDCGEELYGDFDNSNPKAVNELAATLQSSSSDTSPSSRIQSPNQGGSEHFPPSISIPTQATSSANNLPMTNSIDSRPPPVVTSTASAAAISDPQYLALCVNTGEFTTTLAEVEVSDVASDAELFERLKLSYRNLRGFRVRFSFLIKPVAMRFVRFNLYNLRSGYVALCDTDNPCCIPSPEVREYRYRPVPLDLPPMPSRVFLHYLNHGNQDGTHQQRYWVHRLPKRLKERIIDGRDNAVWGWGIHVMEGPNRPVVFWITMLTMLASVLASALWSAMHDDIQGGTGLGSMIIALPPVIMAAFLFRFTAE